MVSLQVRDVEASLQEAVLDQIDQLILSKVSAAGTADAAGRAVGALGSLLAALTEPGTTARVSLGQAIASLAAKRRLRGDKAAKGLQNIICAAGASSFPPPAGQLKLGEVGRLVLVNLRVWKPGESLSWWGDCGFQRS